MVLSKANFRDTKIVVVGGIKKLINLRMDSESEPQVVAGLWDDGLSFLANNP